MFPELGSVVNDEVVAVFEIVAPFGVFEGTATTMVMLLAEGAPTPVVPAQVHVTVPVPPTAGVTQLAPELGETETKVVPDGTVSWI